MKQMSRKTIILLIMFLLILPTLMVSAAPDSPAKGDFRGVWVSSVLNIDYPSKPTIDSDILKSEAIAILDNVQYMGFNAVFLQVRPASDALYKSKYFPWSKYLTGIQGQAPDDDFDPLEFWVTEAHKRGIELHAWINPYRVTKKTSNEPNYDFASLDASNPARLNPGWVVKYTDGNLYYNPGISEVRELVIDSVLEIIENYDVDGIHLDDYFYPGNDFNDKATYEKYGAGYASINDWRRANVNALISDLSKAIKATSKKVRFGVSPFGIWANKGTNVLGSDTKGNQSYYDHYADTRKWVKDGVLDYIAPQLYWNIGYSVADYSKLADWWKNVVYGTGVDLYIGQAAYKAGGDDPLSPWYGVSEIGKQMQLNEKSPVIKGSIFFSYKSLVNNPALGAVIKAIYEKKDGIKAGIPVNVSKPSENMRTSYDQYYIYGSSDPAKPLFMNGKPVEGRSKQGYFGVLVPLTKGRNTFTFSQEASYDTRVIYRDVASSTPKKMSKAEIPSASVFPQKQEYRAPGEKITLYCQAPAGSKVTVKLGGKSYVMKPSTTTKTSGLYPDKYTYVYTMPNYTGTPRNIDLGAPVYTMNYKGIVKTSKAPAKVGVIMESSPYYAKAAKDVVYTYEGPSSDDGAAYELYKGMSDNITGMTGSYVRLSSGQWANKGDVWIYSSKVQQNAAIKSAVYRIGEEWDTLKLDMSAPAAAIADFDGVALKLTVSTAAKAVLPVLPGDSLFSSSTVSKTGGGVQYILKLKDKQCIEGYYIEKTAAGIILNIKRPVKVSGGNEPLSGITIMLDPGHGGSSAGAIGPLGLNYSEKVINLKTALKLQAELQRLGAEVLMTRTTDKDVSLDERLTASRNAKPDMFISIHANSMEDNVDISKVDGFSAYYREALSKPLAETVFNYTVEALDRNDKGVHNNNFYVIRGTWAPSILLESGFVPNPNEFEWLIDENEQARLAKSISEAIVKYFSN
ncbi:MAG: family 10 glycosylhydrolase [Caulobacteraceae bacterium]